MYQSFSNLLLFSDLGEGSILENLSNLMRSWEEKSLQKADLRRGIMVEIKRLLDLATQYGFDHNLWHNYLTFLLMTNENSFTRSCERVGAESGSVHHFARGDAGIFRELFHFDFRVIEEDLGLDCFTTICNYQSLPKRAIQYNRSVSEKVQKLSLALSETADAEAFYTVLTAHYKAVGVGMFGLNPAFRILRKGDALDFLPIHNMDSKSLDELVGYELQKEKLRQNTEGFLEGRNANNVLLYGDSGTGKSTSVKALISEYYDRGLRMIEIYKHQFTDLSEIIALVKNRNYRFIIFMDDLSFEENEVEYKFLKAVIEGGVETKPENVLIYATSNRRHLIRETWNDRGEMELRGDIHRSDTVEEKLSLSSRFGVKINYDSPDRQEFHNIVLELAARAGITMEEEELYGEARKWELRHGGLSGRTAQQFVNDLAGKMVL